MSYLETNEFDPIVTYIFLSLLLLYLVYCCCECCIFITKQKNDFNVVNLNYDFFEEIDNNNRVNEYQNNNLNISQNQQNFNRLFVI